MTRDGSTQLVYWRGASGQLEEAWYAGQAWHGPADLTSWVFGGAAPLASAPSVTTTTDGSQQIVYWQSTGDQLVEAWYAGGAWHGPLDLTADLFGGAGRPASAPSVSVTPDGSHAAGLLAGRRRLAVGGVVHRCVERPARLHSGPSRGDPRHVRCGGARRAR